MTSVEVATPRQEAVEPFRDRRRRVVSLEIERVALSEFAVHGYENVTIEQIASAAGLTVRTFYRYFSNKEDVLLAMPRRVAARLCDAVGARPPDEGLIASYRHVIAARADASPEDEQIALQWRAIFRRSSSLPWMVAHPSVVDTIVTVIARRLGVDAGHDSRPRVIAAAVTGVLDVALARWLATGGSADRQAFMIEALDILESIGALRCRPVPPPIR